MTYRSLMFRVSARAENAVVADIHSYISRIGCIAKTNSKSERYLVGTTYYQNHEGRDQRIQRHSCGTIHDFHARPGFCTFRTEHHLGP